MMSPDNMNADPEEAEQLRMLESNELSHVTSSGTIGKLLNLFKDQSALRYNGVAPIS